MEEQLHFGELFDDEKTRRKQTDEYEDSEIELSMFEITCHVGVNDDLKKNEVDHFNDHVNNRQQDGPVLD